MTQQTKANGKTSIWMYASTQDLLSNYRMGGESWDRFLNRAMRIIEKSRAEIEIDSPRTSGKRTTIWVNKTTRDAVNTLRRGSESWDTFFRRIASTMEIEGVEPNPN